MGRKSKLSPCRLCLKTTRLCRSHVVPELAYARAYDERHRLIEVDRAGRNNGYVQKGTRERLLCSDCEVGLNGWETYFANFVLPQIPNRTDVAANRIDLEVDYARFKLFHLSILWRMSVATVRGFDHFRFDARTEESLREHLVASDPGPVAYWLIGGDLLVGPGSRRPAQIVSGASSHPLVGFGQEAWSAMFASCHWYYIPDGSRIGNSSGRALSLDGRLVLGVRDVLEFPTFFNLVVESLRAKNPGKIMPPGELSWF